MTNLKDQLEERIRSARDRPGKPGQKARQETDEAEKRFDEIRTGLDELAHATDTYSLKVSYAKGPYSETIAVVELDDIGGTWVASWQIAPTVSGSVPEWEVTYNPHGVETQHEWFANSEDLLKYLTASIAERVVEMEADGGSVTAFDPSVRPE